MTSAQALLTLIMGSISKTTIGVTTSSLAERNGCSSQSFLTLVASIGRPVSSHASRLCGQRHCQLNNLIALQASLPLTAVASKSESASSNLPPGIAVSPPCDRNVLARCDNMTYKSLISRPRGGIPNGQKLATLHQQLCYNPVWLTLSDLQKAPIRRPPF